MKWSDPGYISKAETIGFHNWFGGMIKEFRMSPRIYD